MRFRLRLLPAPPLVPPPLLMTGVVAPLQDGLTAMMVAVPCGNPEIVQLLCVNCAFLLLLRSHMRHPCC